METSVDSTLLGDTNLLAIVEEIDHTLNESLPEESQPILSQVDISPVIPIKYLDSGIQHNGSSLFDDDNEVDLPSFDRENASINGESRTLSILSQDTTSSPNKLSRRQETILRLEMRKKYEEEQLTFHPKLKSSRRNSGASEQYSPPDVGGSNRFDRLYNEARKRQENKTENITNENFTFKPEISRRARSTERSSSVEDRTNRLYNGVGAGRRNSLSEKEGSTNGKDKSSFQPKITKRAKSIERTESVDDRLYSRAVIYQEKHNQLKAAIIKREEELCPFQPKLNKTRSSSAQKEHDNSRRLEVGDRMQRYLEDRQRRLEEAKRAKKEQEDVHAPFKPTLVTKKSTTKEVNGDVFTRLAADAEKEPKPVFIDESELTFKPQINSRRSLTPTKTEFSSVHERLHKIGELRKKERDVERQVAREEEERDLTFTPHMTSKKNFELVDRVPVFERLSLSRQYVQEILTQIKSEYELTDCTFRPEINPLTQKVAEARNFGNTPVHVRLNTEAERLKALAKKREDAIKDKELEGCTFSPQVPKVTANLKTEVDVFTRLANTTTASLSAGLGVLSSQSAHHPNNTSISFSGGNNSDLGSSGSGGISTPSPRKSFPSSPTRANTTNFNNSSKNDSGTIGVNPMQRKSFAETVSTGSAIGGPKSTTTATVTTPKSSSHLLSSSFDNSNSSSSHSNSNNSNLRPASHSYSHSSPVLGTSSSTSNNNSTSSSNTNGNNSNSYQRPTSASKARKTFYSKAEIIELEKNNPVIATGNHHHHQPHTTSSATSTTPSNAIKLSNGVVQHSDLSEKQKHTEKQPEPQKEEEQLNQEHEQVQSDNISLVADPVTDNAETTVVTPLSSSVQLPLLTDASPLKITLSSAEYSVDETLNAVSAL